jgi:hypothetical protein
MSSHRASDSCPPCSKLKARVIPFFMNTSALKTFAPAVRKQLMEAVTRKLDFAIAAQTPDYLTTFAPQVAALRKLAQADRAGIIERVAYTWFNRLAALRFMDARGWHACRSGRDHHGPR